MSALLSQWTGGRAATGVLLATASFGFCIAGLGTLLQGARVPVQAQIAQVELQRDFDRDLAVTVPVAPVMSPARGKSIVVLGKLKLDDVAPRQVRGIAPGKPLARIAVKRLDVEDVILAGQPSHDELARGPMMVKRGDASSPVTVLAAHRDTHFLFVRDLREGDIVTMQYVTGESETYRVTYFETVRWNEFAYPLDPPRPLLALTTCYPFGGTEYGGPWRRVAWAEKIG